MLKPADVEISALILAAGKGTRMKSDIAKVLHPIGGKPMLAYVIDVSRSLGINKIAVIIGYQGESVRDNFPDQEITFVEQREQLGTGHAVLQAKDVFRYYKGTILILCGDVPLLRSSTLKDFIECHIQSRSTITILTTILSNPTGYGRIVRHGIDGMVSSIVEEKDALPEQKEIREINTGIYCVNSEFLFEAVGQIGNNNIQKEYYLTDIIEIACKKGLKVMSFIARDYFEVMGINTPEDLKIASAVLEDRRRLGEVP